MMVMTVWTLVTISALAYWVWTTSNERPKKALGYVCLTSLSAIVAIKTIGFFYPLPFL